MAQIVLCDELQKLYDETLEDLAKRVCHNIKQSKRLEKIKKINKKLWKH